jgi:hypothetical protein
VPSFSSLDHRWLERFLEHRIADRRVLRLVQKWLAAGVIEEGTWTAYEEGVSQGASAKWGVRDRCDGTVTVVEEGAVIVDDFVLHRTVVARTGQTYLAKAP